MAVGRMTNPELNVPRHSYYQKRNHIRLPRYRESKWWIDVEGAGGGGWWTPLGANILLYDFLDKSTLRQTLADTVPVTAAGQPISRINDITGNNIPLLKVAGTCTYQETGGFPGMTCSAASFAANIGAEIPVTNAFLGFAGEVNTDGDGIIGLAESDSTSTYYWMRSDIALSSISMALVATGDDGTPSTLAASTLGAGVKFAAHGTLNTLGNVNNIIVENAVDTDGATGLAGGLINVNVLSLGGLAAGGGPYNPLTGRVFRAGYALTDITPVRASAIAWFREGAAL